MKNSIDAEELIDLLNKTQATTTESHRFSLTCTKFTFKKRRIFSAFTTDGVAYSNGMFRFKTPHGLDDSVRIVDLSELNKKRRVLKGDVQVSIDDRRFTFKWDNGRSGKSNKAYEVQCPIAASRYPDIRNAIPTTLPDGTASINPSQWVEAYSAWSSEHVEFELSENSFSRAVAPKFSIRSHTGCPIKFSGDMGLLIPALQRFSTEEVLIEYWKPEGKTKWPLIIREPSYEYGLMPRD